MGCYLEVDYPEDMTTMDKNNGGYDVDTCILYCESGRAWQYAAVYGGTECKCDQAFGRYGLQPDDKCNMCEGSTDQLCRGTIAVYNAGDIFYNEICMSGERADIIYFSIVFTNVVNQTILLTLPGTYIILGDLICY